MSTHYELMSYLAKLPLWKRLQPVPDDIQNLNERVVLLETVLSSARGASCQVCETAPDEIQHLNERVVLLEAVLYSAVGALCPICETMGLKLISSVPHPRFGDLGLKQNIYVCTQCNYRKDELIT